MSEEQTWQERLPESVRATSLVTRSENEEQFWDRVAEFDSFRGNAIRIPGEDAGEEAINDFNSKLREKVPGLMPVPTTDDDSAYDEVMMKLGTPENAEGYKLPEGVEMPEEQLKFLVDLAASTGMTKRQFKKMVKDAAEEGQLQQQQGQEWNHNQVERLKGEWGMAAEERYNEVIAFAKQSNAPERLQKVLEAKNASAEEVLWLYELTKASKETPAMTGDDLQTTQQAKTLDPFEAQEKINEMLANPDHPYHQNSGNPNHPATKRYIELVRMANAAA